MLPANTFLRSHTHLYRHGNFTWVSRYLQPSSIRADPKTCRWGKCLPGNGIERSALWQHCCEATMGFGHDVGVRRSSFCCSRFQCRFNEKTHMQGCVKADPAGDNRKYSFVPLSIFIVLFSSWHQSFSHALFFVAIKCVKHGLTVS